MIATDVTGTFLVPLKVTLMAAFLIALALRALPDVGLRRAGPLPAREAAGAAGDRVQRRSSSRSGWRSPISSCSRSRSDSSPATRPTGVQMMTDIDKYLSFALTMFIAFGITFEVPVVVVVLVRFGVVELANAARDPRLRHRRRVRRRRDLHAARRAVAGDARRAAVAALRAGAAGRALRLRVQAARRRGTGRARAMKARAR